MCFSVSVSCVCVSVCGFCVVCVRKLSVWCKWSVGVCVCVLCVLFCVCVIFVVCV
jgi:hypothetical protein